MYWESYLTLPKKSLLTLCKSFIRPHLGYGEVVYDQSNNDTFCGKHEFILSNAALAITAEIKGSFRESDLLNDCLAFTTSKHITFHSIL